MKFPYELSTDRLSLLSEEDQQIYEYEHSPFYSWTERQKAIEEYQRAKLMRQGYYLNMINEDVEYDEMSDLEKDTMSKQLSEIEALTLLEEIMDMMDLDLYDSLDAEDVEAVKKYATSLLLQDVNVPEDNAINEVGTAPGHDMTYWIPNMGGALGWLGNIAGAAIGTGLAGMIGLIMAGYDKRAAKNLEKYMNKLVELTDTGLHKKKSFFSFFGVKLGKTKKNEGDQSQACFRAIQEFVERDMAKNAMLLGKACGLLTGNGLDDANSNTYTNGGLFGNIPGSFKTNVLDKLNVLITRQS